MTVLELRHATVGYPQATSKAAVEAGLRECPFQHLANAPGFGGLVTFWLVDPDSVETLPPPLTEARSRPSTSTWSPARTDGGILAPP
jgi:hypothetical protein